MKNSVRRSKLLCVSWGLSLGLAACSAEPGQGASPEPLGRAQQAVNLAAATATCSNDPRVELGLVSESVCVGAELFFRDDFGGNGRSCASCHPADNNYTIDAEFIAGLPSDDPLFVAETPGPLAGLEIPDLLRDFGLILENVDGAENPTQKFTLRSVPHCLSLSRSITADGTLPALEHTGWSGDGAPGQGRLKDFQTGAIFQHYPRSLARQEGVDFVPATESELDALDAFMKTIGRTNELTLATVSLSDPGAEAGRVTFMSPAARCNGCHNNAGANNAAGINRNFDTGVERVRLSVLDARGIPRDGGAGGQGLASFNFDADGDGTLDSFGDGRFNTPPLIEAADTGPFFHTNAFETIEDAVEFYTTSTFALSPAGQAGAPVDLSPAEVANIGRFLRVLNAAFNIQLALARVEAVLPIIIDGQNQTRALQQELARLALVEVDDALDVLGGQAGLNAAEQTLLLDARALLETASSHASHTQRRRAAQDARDALLAADAGLGSGMAFVMGEGTHMF